MCSRCGAAAATTVSIDVFGRHTGTVELCAWCEVALFQFLRREVRPMEWHEWNDEGDADDGEHHTNCMCIECNPDFHMELRREARFDAERAG